MYQPRLNQTFCFSDDQAAAEQVATGIASTIREEQAYDPPLGESEPIASGAKVIAYKNPNSDYYAYISKACQYLNFIPLWGNPRHVEHHREKAPDNALRRLRYLMDGWTRGGFCLSVSHFCRRGSTGYSR